MAKVAMPGAGFIGDFYTYSLHGQRSRDQVRKIYSRQPGQSDCNLFHNILYKSISHE